MGQRKDFGRRVSNSRGRLRHGGRQRRAVSSGCSLFKGRAMLGPPAGKPPDCSGRWGCGCPTIFDGGGSTGLMVGGAMNRGLGRGVSASIHNGLGLVPRFPTQTLPLHPERRPPCRRALTVHLSGRCRCELAARRRGPATPGLMHLDLVEGGCERWC